MLLEVLHVIEPPEHKEAKDPAGISREVHQVCSWQRAEITPGLEFLLEVEDSHEELGECLVLEEGRVLEEAARGTTVATRGMFGEPGGRLL